MNEVLPLTERLATAAEAWANAASATLSKLGKLVVNDTGFFESLPSRKHGPSTATLEKFARFLADPANWPDCEVAEEAKALAHVTGVSAPGAVAAAGRGGEISPALGSAAA